MERINRIVVHQFRIPLKQPYRLSFTTVTNLDSYVVEVITEASKSGFGEVVPLDGYFRERSEDVLSDLKNICRQVSRLTIDECFELVRSNLYRRSLACSAVLSALEMLKGNFIPQKLEIPLAGIMSFKNESVVDDYITTLKAGYKCVKIKIGANVETDIINSCMVLQKTPPHILVRFDANQAYDLNSALAFVHAITPYRSKVAYLEQPLDIDAWEEFAFLIEKSDIPIMIDESINTEQDVLRASSIGCSYIKLKLFKHGGIQELCNLSKKAKDLNLKVIMGNGVSTDIGNLAEGWAYHYAKGVFEEVAESNGFLKCTQPQTNCPPEFFNGRMVWHRPPLIALNDRAPVAVWTF